MAVYVVCMSNKWSRGSEGDIAWELKAAESADCARLSRAAALIEGTHVPNIKIQEPVISSD